MGTAAAADWLSRRTLGVICDAHHCSSCEEKRREECSAKWTLRRLLLLRTKWQQQLLLRTASNCNSHRGEQWERQKWLPTAAGSYYYYNSSKTVCPVDGSWKERERKKIWAVSWLCPLRQVTKWRQNGDKGREWAAEFPSKRTVVTSILSGSCCSCSSSSSAPTFWASVIWRRVYYIILI